MQESKVQKKTAYILLGTGVGIAAPGSIVQLIHERNTRYSNCFDFNFTGAWIAIGGGVVAFSVIPFFIINKRATSIAISNQNIILHGQNGLAAITQATMTIKTNSSVNFKLGANLRILPGNH